MYVGGSFLHNLPKTKRKDTIIINSGIKIYQAETGISFFLFFVLAVVLSARRSGSQINPF